MVPSPSSVSNRSFLADARAQLDNDHFGLEKIKKRLIEYLAVVRLKERREREVQEENNAKVEDTKALQVASNTSPNPNPSPALAPKRSRKGVKGPILL